MATPEAVEDAWKEAETLLGDGEAKAALKALRKAWKAEPKEADVGKTWAIAADCKAKLAQEADGSGSKKFYRESLQHFEKSLNKEPSKEVRRRMNVVQGSMDEMGITRGGIRLLDDGAPTLWGLTAIILISMMFLVSLKYYPDALTFLKSGGVDEQSTTAMMTLSYQTNAGDPATRQTATIIVELDADAAPMTVENFIMLSEQGDFNNTVFHRIIDGFMIQGGDYEKGDGTGGYTAKWYGSCNGEVMADSADCPRSSWSVPDEVSSGLGHDPCVISMANAGPNTGASQFFILPEDAVNTQSGEAGTHWLDGKHTVFGKVTSGCEHVTAISNIETGQNDLPLAAVTLVSVQMVI